MKHKKEIVSGIYGLRCIVNNKWYIGFSINIYKRWEDYKNLQCKRQPRIYNALVKYGFDNFEKVIIEKLTSEIPLLAERERYWIKTYGSFPNGYNLNEGGKGGGPKIWSNELRELHSKLKKGKKLSEKAKDNMRKAQLGRKHPDEVKLKISISNTGKVYSEETLEKMRMAKRGRTLTEEHKKKIGLGGLGKKHSPETILKMKEARAKLKDPMRLKQEEKDEREILEFFNVIKYLAGIPNHSLIRIINNLYNYGSIVSPYTKD